MNINRFRPPVQLAKHIQQPPTQVPPPVPSLW